jgi:hypothetical protein
MRAEYPAYYEKLKYLTSDQQLMTAFRGGNAVAVLEGILGVR